MNTAGNTVKAIDPTQVDAINQAFRPTDEERDRARAVLAALAAPGNAGRGALRLDGRLVDEATVKWARAMLQDRDDSQ